MPKLEELRAKAQATAERIAAEGYYPQHWAHANAGQPTIAEATSRETLLARFQIMWDVLPDSRDIRTGPFFAICDLAEEYCFGEDEEA